MPVPVITEGTIDVPRNDDPLVAGALFRDVVILAIAILVLDDGIGAEIVRVVFQIDVFLEIRRFVSRVGESVTEGVNVCEIVLYSRFILIVPSVGFWGSETALIT